MRKLVVATRSQAKLAEIRRILGEGPELHVLDLDEAGVPPDPAEEHLEPHDTFEENALSKARHFHALTGLPTVADDSGLEVDALAGAPGVRSKRFAPEEGLEGKALDQANNRHLLRLLEGVPHAERGARYVCTAVLVDGDAPPLVRRGEVSGVIAEQPRGAGGFGYDPLFLVPSLGKTFAEISMQEKNAMSHRGRAFQALALALAEEA